MKRISAVTMAVAGLLVAGLTGCGGGGSSDPNASVSSGPAAALVVNYASGLAALNSKQGLQSTTFANLFSSTFLDAGYTRAQLTDNLAKDAASLDGAAAVSLFPNVTLTKTSLDCPAGSNICTLTGTLANSDADLTEATFSTQVINNNGTYQLLGDQKSS